MSTEHDHPIIQERMRRIWEGQCPGDIAWASKREDLLKFLDKLTSEMLGTQPKPLAVMKSYLLLKFEQDDWNGVADAANDIREMLAKK